ncbi:MAG: DUF5320 domain-containing protein [Armatimonadota bacterium]|jgi:hypothetical protein
MPGLDGTGPAGMGPMTGGGRGWCNPYSPVHAGGYPSFGYGAYAPRMLPWGPYGMGGYGGVSATGYGMVPPFHGQAFPPAGMHPYAAAYTYRPFAMGFGMRMPFGGRGMRGRRGGWGGRGMRMW